MSRGTSPGLVPGRPARHEKMSCLAGPAQGPGVDIPQWTAVSGALRAVGERSGEMGAHAMGYCPKFSNGDHWELSKNRFDRNYIQHRLFGVQLVQDSGSGRFQPCCDHVNYFFK